MNENTKMNPLNQPAKSLMDSPMELEMQIDLLVDEELAETQRQELLRHLERQPGLWRSLSIRFLERQTEKRTARHILISATPLPVPQSTSDNRLENAALQAPNPYVLPQKTLWKIGPRALAAGLLVAAVSAFTTWYGLTNRPVTPPTDNAMITANLPGAVVGMSEMVSVDVPVSHERGNAISSSMFMTSDSQDALPSRQSLVIQPDGQGGAVVVPVNTLTSVSWQ